MNTESKAETDWKQQAREDLIDACVPFSFRGPLPEYIRIWFGQRPSDDGPGWQDLSDKIQAAIRNAVESALEEIK